MPLNSEGTRKILKKYDKNIRMRPLPERVRADVNAQLESTGPDGVKQLLDALHHLFARVACQGDVRQAEHMLSSKIRPWISYTRDVVWRQMAEEEHSHHTVHVTSASDMMAAKTMRYVARRYGPKILTGTLALAAFFTLLCIPVFLDTWEQQACLAMLVLVLTLWIMEVLDLFVTALLVPIITVTLGLVDPPYGEPPYVTLGDARESALGFILSVMWNETVALLMGGFTIAAALSKTNLAKMFASLVMRAAGSNVSSILLGSMLLSAALSTFISNVAAPVLMYSVVDPLLRTHDASSPIAQALVLGIAFAANCGGMLSPIASPQNVFGVAYMSIHGAPPGWGLWFAIAVPVGLTCTVIIWLQLVVFKLGKGGWGKRIRPLEGIREKLTLAHYYTLGVSVATVALWLLNTQLLPVFGGMGLTAMLPMVALFGAGVLQKDDLKAFPWEVVFLAMGGVVMGEAVKATGLLEYVVERIEPAITDFPLMGLYACILVMVALAATFISHTVAAMVLVPVASTLGAAIGRQNMLVMGTALMCSGAMALQISGFPNMFASGRVDGLGRRFAEKHHILAFGTVSTIVCVAVIAVPGFYLMDALLDESEPEPNATLMEA